jgi:hypothetical protein
MKTGIASVLALFTFGRMAAQDQTNTINTTGNHAFEVPVEFTSKMIVSLSNVYYDTETMDLDALKATYRDKLSKAGMDISKLKEDRLAYALMGYDKDGTIMTYTTQSLEEMQKFLLVRSLGISRSDTVMKATLTDAQMADLAVKAIENARQKAQAIAQKLGRNIGKAVYISDSNANEINESIYYGSPMNKRTYYVNVSFELL